ncbi:ubiquitin-like small modifier protein SAMP2 [Natronomonas marina]|jgi:sulfur carrier protein|uniref:ubiquitin-like small modifier protein SAMP2 n=1 Tax=Natronomonas marina TaxID=2961939 RepID=UPI0020C93D06|nr:ubiquitin-like small modifier protein 2 [Natronomonas marina]
MRVTCAVVGGDTHDLELDAEATYGDVLAAVGLSTQEASVLVDGSPVPEDRPVDADSVRVLRLVKGG